MNPAIENTNPAVQGSRPSTESNQQTTRQTNRSQSQQRQSSSYAVQGNQGNHYNGRWFAAGTHSGWSQQSNHYWNNHEYGWYDGGWLIIDPGYSPDYVVSPGYVVTGPTSMDVQQRLTQQGYYSGPIDGDIGPRSRLAISNYQSANGLQISGQIDQPLLVSLKLE
jgi:N-acetylmuramoyl-L-alanine amidase